MLISARVKPQRVIFIALESPILGVRPNNLQSLEHNLMTFARYYHRRYIYSLPANVYFHICNSKITSGAFLIILCYFSGTELIYYDLYHNSKWYFMGLMGYMVSFSMSSWQYSCWLPCCNNSTVIRGLLSVWAKCNYFNECYCERHQQGTMALPGTISVPSCTYLMKIFNHEWH